MEEQRELHYRREARRTFMQLEAANGDCFEEKMLLGIRDVCLLPLQMICEDGRKYARYEISALQPLRRLAERGRVREAELRALIQQIDGALAVLERHMLSEAELCLNADTIYYDEEEERFRFCALPQGEFCISAQLRCLALFLFSYLEAGSEAVLICHRLYLKSGEAGISAEDFLRIVYPRPAQRQHPKLQEQGREYQRQIPEQSQKQQRSYGGTYRPQPPEPSESCGRNADTILAEEMSDRLLPDAFEEDLEDSALGKRALFGKAAALEIGICAAILFAAPVLVVLLRGAAAALRMLPVFCVIDIGAILYLILNRIEKKRRREKETEVPEEADEEDAEAEGTAAALELASMQRECAPAAERCIPRSSGRQKNEMVRELHPLNQTMPKIRMDRFPFVIGRDPKSTDFILQDVRVSRMHAAFHRDEQGYYMTDLNSANGTGIEGRMLNANETVPIEPGQEISIAGIGYVFA